MEFVSVTLSYPQDSIPVNGTMTDEEGKFHFDDVMPGTYLLSASIIGFETFTSVAFTIGADAAVKNMPIIYLRPSEILLRDLEIIDEKPMLVSEIDRKVYYPANDLLAQAGSATDVMQNIPSVTVDVDGQLSLRGSANVTILINGRPSSLLKINSAGVLQQLPAASIERIEIITNPSAKYRPNGTAGIINIVLKKNATLGFNGTVTVNAGTHNRHNGNVTLNYHPGKLNLVGSYGFRKNYFERKLSEHRIIKDTTEATTNLLELSSSAFGGQLSHIATLGVDYAPGEKNKVGISGSYFFFDMERTQDVSTLLRNAELVLSDYSTAGLDLEEEWEGETTAYWEHVFEEDNELALEVSYAAYDELEDSRYTDVYAVPDYADAIGHNIVNKGGSDWVAAADYARPVAEDLELEAGYEGEFSKGDLRYSGEYFDHTTSLWVDDSSKNNRFLFRQDLHAAYVTLGMEIEDLGILAGFRAEQLFFSSDLVTLDTSSSNNYFNLFPTLHLSYALGENQELGLSYGRRLNRPDADEMNPFPEYQDPRNVEAGNPNLKPEQVHSIELGYQLRKNGFTFTPGLYYRQTYDAFTEITSYINDSTLLTTFDNLSTDRSGGLELILSWSAKKKMNINLSSNIFYQTIDGSDLGYPEKKSVTSTDSKLAATFSLTRSTKLQLNATYRSAFLSLQGKSFPHYFLNTGLRQDVFKQKATLTLTVSDVFNTANWKYEIDTDEVYQLSERKRKSQIVYLGFVYHFGMFSKKNMDDMQFEDRM